MHISNKCSVAVHCLLYIHEYGSKTKVTSELLSVSTGCNPVTIRGILSSLKKEGILNVRHGIGGATLKCSLKDVSLYRVCMAVEPTAIHRFMGIHSSPSKDCPIGRDIHSVLSGPYQVLQNDLIESMKKVQIQDFIDEYHQLQADRA